LVDGSTLDAVLGALAEVCWAKGIHVAEAWQDKALSKAWDKAGNVIDKARGRIDV